MKIPTARLWLILLAAASLLPVAVRASKETPIIGLSLDTLALDRWQRDRDTFVATVESLGGKVLVENANSDDATQVKNIEKLLERHVDAIVIVPHNAAALTKALEAAKVAKVPTISYDRLILNAPLDYYLSFDNVKVGEAQASYLAAHVPSTRPARIVRIYGAPTDNNAKIFKQGQDKVLAPLIAAGKIEVVYEAWAGDWSATEAKRIMAAAIAKSGKSIDGVLASNDNTAGGAVEAMEEAGVQPGVCVTGQDADRAACVRIKTGKQSMTVYKPLDKLAVLAARVATDLVKGNIPQATTATNNGVQDVPSIFEDIVSVDATNIDSTVIAAGFLKKK